MRTVAQVFALLAVMAFAGFAYAAKEAKDVKAAPKTLKGEIVKVDGNNLILKTGTGGKQEVTVATNEKTKVVVAGKASKLAELKPGQRVVVTPATGIATKIQVPKPRAAKKPAAKH